MFLGAFLVIQFLISSYFLLYAAYWDLKARQVSNWPFLAWAILGFTEVLGEYGFTVLLVVHLLFTVFISSVFLFVWWKWRAFIGGADVKAIMALSIGLSIVSLPVVAWSVFFLVFYLIFKTLKNKLTVKEVMALKAPFLPFMLFGLCLTLVLMLLS